MVPPWMDINPDAVVAGIPELERTNRDTSAIDKCLFRELYSGVGLKAITCDVTWAPEVVPDWYGDAIGGDGHIEQRHIPCPDAPVWLSA